VKQRTVKKEFELVGTGLHSGGKVSVRVLPAQANTGVVFVRTDLGADRIVPAHYQNIVNTRLATTLAYKGVAVSTVEHLLAALRGWEVDNARVEVGGPELPIMDGSALDFSKSIQAVGVREQNEVRPYIKIKKKIDIELEDGRWAVVEPSKNFLIDASFDWQHPMMQEQNFKYTQELGAFDEISDARTFCMAKDIEMMKRLGLAKGGSLDNAIVLTEDGIANGCGLREPSEFGRHKVLDTIGDLRLAGLNVVGKFTVHKTGHSFNQFILKRLFEDLGNIEIVDGPNADDPAKRLYNYLQNIRVAAG